MEAVVKRKIVAILQARTDSTRLPRKVLKPLLGKAMIIQELIRVNRSKILDKLILVTSEEASDNELTNIVREHGFNVFRGSKNNVLERFYKCAEDEKLQPNDIIVRLTGDCPLHDSTIIDELIEVFLDSKCDYMANCIKPIYPDGLDVEVFTFESLKKAYKEAKKTSEQEHVTPYIRNSGFFDTIDLKKDSIYPEWRLTVDEPSDFIVVEKIYNYFKDNNFSFTDVVIYLKNNPVILEINSDINRNEGYLKSLKEDEKKKGLDNG